MSTGADVLVHEREPDDRHVPDVEDDRPGDEGLLRDPLHLARHEMIVRGRQVAAGDVAGRGVHPRGARIGGHVAPYEPVGLPGGNAGQRVLDHAAFGAGVVGDGCTHHHLALVEQVRLASRFQQAAGFFIAYRVGLQLHPCCSVSAAPRAACAGPPRSRGGVGLVPGGLVALSLQQFVQHRVGLRELPGRRRRQSEQARGRGVERLAGPELTEAAARLARPKPGTPPYPPAWPCWPGYTGT